MSTTREPAGPGTAAGAAPQAADGRPGRRELGILSSFGPGLLFAIASMGSSHFLLAPTAGAAAGYTLAWTIVVAHVVKYPAFAGATRYTVAAGHSLLDGMRSLPGPRNWAVWAFTIGAGLQSVTIVAGVTAVCAAVILAAVPALPLATTTLAVCAVAALLLWFGGYPVLERVAVAILCAVAALTVAAVALAGPDLGALATGSVTPGLPAAGAALLVGGLLGYMPAPIELAVLESLWYDERHRGHGEATRARRLRHALVDFRIGYVASIVLGLLLLALGAALLMPRGDVPAGTQVFATIATAYEEALGAWAVPVYLAGAFLGMFATSYGVIDGFPRMVSRGIALLGWPGPVTGKGRSVVTWGLTYATIVGGVLAIVVLPDPARLVSLAATLTVLVAPLWYGIIVALNHRLPAPWRPSPVRRAGDWLGFGGMCTIAAYVAYGLWG